MSNWKEKRKQKRTEIAIEKEKEDQAKFEHLTRALDRIKTLSMDIEEVHITRGARDPEDGDILIDIAEINCKIMETCDAAINDHAKASVNLPALVNQ